MSWGWHIQNPSTWSYYRSWPQLSQAWPTYPSNQIQHPWQLPPPPQSSGAHIRGGVNPATTLLHAADKLTEIKVILGEAWTLESGKDHRGPQFTFYSASLRMTIGELVEKVTEKEKWTMTELYERGGGDFMIGIEIAEGSRAANRTLGECGFARENVFVWIH